MNKEDKGTVFLIVLLTSCLFIHCQMNYVFGYGENWLDGWDYRQLHDITGSDGASTGYQIFIIIDYGSGTSEDGVCYVDGKCNIDFSDIRFTDDDGETVLYHWLINYVESDYGNFSFRVEDSLADEETAHIYIYYGNEEAEDISDVHNTMCYYNNFNGETAGNPPSYFDSYDDTTVSDISPYEGDRCIRFADNDGGLYPAYLDMTDLPDNIEVTYAVKISSSGKQHVFSFEEDGSNLYQIGAIYGNPANYISFREIISGGENIHDYYPFSWGVTWHRVVFNKYLTNYYYSVDGTSVDDNDLDMQMEFTGFQINAWNSQVIFYDEIMIRQYTYPEPAHDLYGEEETEVPTPTPTPTATSTPYSEDELSDIALIAILAFIVGFSALLLTITKKK